MAIALIVAVALVGCGSKSGTSSRSGAAGHGLVARGRFLYDSEGCSDCHSLDGTRRTGPTWKGLAGSKVTLQSGETVTATAAYLTEHILKPNAMAVNGYPSDVMAESTEGLHLEQRPEDVRALVAFIQSLR